MPVSDPLAALRLKLLDIGYEPIPVFDPAARCRSPGKQPAVRGWQRLWETERREDIPIWELMWANARNTGILAAGLRVIDGDVDRPDVAIAVRALAEQRLGKTIVRTREGSPRFSMVYRAADGQPGKGSVAGKLGKVEVLGAGQQFVAYGKHLSGKRLRWPDGGPDTVPRDSLPAVTEKQIASFLADAGALIEATPAAQAEQGLEAVVQNDHQTSRHGLTADPELVADALLQIPNDGPADWERWNHTLMAVYNATENKGQLEEEAREWSAKHPAHDDEEFDARWLHYSGSPPARIGAGSLFHLAREATGWTRAPAPSDHDIDAMFPADDVFDERRRERYRVYTVAECASAPPRGYIVKNLLAPRDVGSIFGPPAAGKSMLAPQMGYMVALGRTVFGQRVRKGKVLYVAAEDLTGMLKRVTALKREHGDTPDFLVMAGVSDLLTKASPDLAALRKVVEERRPALIVVDTLAMAFPGLKENEADDMGRVIGIARGLTQWDAAVVLIHHEPKAKDGTPRGHSSLNGALDVAVCLSPADANGIVRGHLTKNRNGAADLRIAFRIETRDGGSDEDGDAIRLPLAVEATSEPGAPKLARSEQAALDVLIEMALLGGGPVQRIPPP